MTKPTNKRSFDKWSLLQIADHCGLTPQRIQQLIKQHSIPTHKISRKTYLTPEAADDVYYAWQASRVAWHINHRQKLVNKLNKKKDKLCGKIKTNVTRNSDNVTRCE